MRIFGHALDQNELFLMNVLAQARRVCAEEIIDDELGLAVRLRTALVTRCQGQTYSSQEAAVLETEYCAS